MMAFPFQAPILMGTTNCWGMETNLLVAVEGNVSDMVDDFEGTVTDMTLLEGETPDFWGWKDRLLLKSC